MSPLLFEGKFLRQQHESVFLVKSEDRFQVWEQVIFYRCAKNRLGNPEFLCFANSLNKGRYWDLKICWSIQKITEKCVDTKQSSSEIITYSSFGQGKKHTTNILSRGQEDQSADFHFKVIQFCFSILSIASGQTLLPKCSASILLRFYTFLVVSSGTKWVVTCLSGWALGLM